MLHENCSDSTRTFYLTRYDHPKSEINYYFHNQKRKYFNTLLCHSSGNSGIQRDSSTCLPYATFFSLLPSRSRENAEEKTMDSGGPVEDFRRSRAHTRRHYHFLASPDLIFGCRVPSLRWTSMPLLQWRRGNDVPSQAQRSLRLHSAPQTLLRRRFEHRAFASSLSSGLPLVPASCPY